MKETILKKLTSRKFWICAAAFLASLGMGISGVATENTVVASTGIACSIVSAAIYSAVEASVDKAAAPSKTTTVSATTNSPAVVENVINKVNTPEGGK